MDADAVLTFAYRQSAVQREQVNPRPVREWHAHA